MAQDSAAHVSNINAELEAELHELLQKQAQAAGSFRRMSDVKRALAEAQAQVDKLRSQEAKLREDMAEVEAQRSQLRAAGRADEASLLGYLSNLERQLSSACRAVVSGLCCRAVVVIVSVCVCVCVCVAVCACVAVCGGVAVCACCVCVLTSSTSPSLQAPSLLHASSSRIASPAASQSTVATVAVAVVVTAVATADTRPTPAHLPCP